MIQQSSVVKMRCILSVIDSYEIKSVTVNFHPFVQYIFISANSCQAAMTKSKIPDREVRLLTFRVILETDKSSLSEEVAGQQSVSSF